MKPLKITTPANPRWRKFLGVIFKLQEPSIPIFEPSKPDVLQLASKDPLSYGTENDRESMTSGVVSDIDL